MSDNDEVDFYKGWGDDLDAGVDENGNPLKPVPSEESEGDENGRHKPPDEEEEGLEYPTPKPREKEKEGQMLYDRSPEIYPTGEKKETLLDPDKSKQFAREQFPNSPALAGEPEVLRNFITVPHKISETSVLEQQGYASLKECLSICGACRELDYGRIRDEDLSSVTIDGIQLKNGLIENTTFKDTRARDADFSNCEFIGQVSFDGADLKNSSFKGCDLSSCSFIRADLTNCNLIGATLPEADKLAGALLAGIRTEEPSPQPGIFPG